MIPEDAAGQQYTTSKCLSVCPLVNLVLASNSPGYEQVFHGLSEQADPRPIIARDKHNLISDKINRLCSSFSPDLQCNMDLASE